MEINKDVKTSGAYVLYDKYFVFQVGPTKKSDQLGVVRLGGHKETNETALETAKREVFEEASMKIIPINSPVTYYLNMWEANPVKMQTNTDIAPILVKGNGQEKLSIMYLAYSEDEPKPSSETNGLLLLNPQDIYLICKEKISLNEFLNQNGIAILKRNINRDLILTPYPQLIFLFKLLQEYPDLIDSILGKRGNDGQVITRD